jgi:hypothetical protein
MKIAQVLYRTALTLATICVFNLGCKDGFWTKDRIDPPCPEVTVISPTAAPFGAVVTIRGTEFIANTPTLYEVRIGNVLVDSLEIPDGNSMTFKVPKGIGSGAVSVQLVGACDAAIKPAFTYLLTATNVSKFAGTFGQIGSAACPGCLNTPSGIEVDGAGNVWVADKYNQVVRQISPSGNLSTIGAFKQPGCENVAVPSGTTAHFNWPVDIAVNAGGDVIIAEEVNCTLRKRTTAGVVLPFAGKCGDSDFTDGNCSVSKLVGPSHVAQDGAVTYIADSGRIRKVDASADANCPVISPLVGQGFGLTNAYGIEFSKALMPGLGPIFVTDKSELKIKAVSLSGNVTDIVTSGEGFNIPAALAMDSRGNIFVADEGRNQILVVYPGGLTVVLAGKIAPGVSDNVSGLDAQFMAPTGIAIDPKNNKILYVSDTKSHVIRKITVE